MLQARDLRKLNAQELNLKLTELRKDLRTKSTEVLNQKEKNVKTPRLLRKDIARVLGILKEKQILAEAPSAEAAK